MYHMMCTCHIYMYSAVHTYTCTLHVHVHNVSWQDSWKILCGLLGQDWRVSRQDMSWQDSCVAKEDLVWFTQARLEGD